MRPLTLLTLMSTFGVLLMVSCKKDYTAQEEMLTEEMAKKNFMTETNFKPVSEAEAKKTHGRRIMHFDSYRDAMKYFKSRKAPGQKSSIKNTLTIKIINSELSRISGYGVESLSLYGYVNITASVSGDLFPVTITTTYDHTTNGAVGYLEDPDTGARNYTSYHLDANYVGNVNVHADGITGTLSAPYDLNVTSSTNSSSVHYFIDEDVVIGPIHWRDVIECNLDNSVFITGIPGPSYSGYLTTSCSCSYL